MAEDALDTPLTEQEFYERLECACRSREDMYSLLSRLYRSEVDEGLLAALRDTLFPAGEPGEPIEEGSYLITKYLSNPWADLETDLARDYVRCFIGNGLDAYSAAYPFESVYTSKRRLLMQDARADVLASYRACGFDKSAEWNEGEDHLSVELEFMAALSRRAADALSAGDHADAEKALKVQKSFMAEHVLRWVPLMLSDVGKFAQTDFYRGVALFTDGYLSEDGRFLSELGMGEPATIE